MNLKTEWINEIAMVSLGIGLIMAIYYGRTELAGMIVSAMAGAIGINFKAVAKKENGGDQK